MGPQPAKSAKDEYLRVSIPQSEFCPLGLDQGRLANINVHRVSIPQSEFCPLGLEVMPTLAANSVEFQFLSRNSVRWDDPNQPQLNQCNEKFQFLSRNSVRWDFLRIERRKLSIFVSIPQSEFCPLGLHHILLQTPPNSAFQFLSRNSVRWDLC